MPGERRPGVGGKRLLRCASSCRGSTRRLVEVAVIGVRIGVAALVQQRQCITSRRQFHFVVRLVILTHKVIICVRQEGAAVQEVVHLGIGDDMTGEPGEVQSEDKVPISWGKRKSEGSSTARKKGIGA